METAYRLQRAKLFEGKQRNDVENVIKDPGLVVAAAATYLPLLNSSCNKY